MTAVLQIITDAMMDIGALALEETPTDAEAAACLRALNNLLETWNTEELMIYNVTPHVFSYVANQQSYTIGTGGDFNVPRPVKIEGAFNRGNASTPSEFDIPIYVTENPDEYSSIISKRIATVLPLVVYDNGDYPLKTLYFWPIPTDTTYAPVLWYWTPVSSFATTSDTVSLPPGYQRALQKNLALEICPAFAAAPSQLLGAQAMESKAQIKRINYTVDVLDMPSGIPGTERRWGLGQFLAGYP